MDASALCGASCRIDSGIGAEFVSNAMGTPALPVGIDWRFIGPNDRHARARVAVSG